MSRLPAVAAALALLPAFGGPSGAAGDDAEIGFTRQIRPILTNNCFQCHGPDEAQRKGGSKKTGPLRLDTRLGATKDLGGYAAIVPGKPAKSELILRITSPDPSEIMPPRKHGKPLSPRQIRLLSRWIKAGAKYPTHWSFVKPRRPALPKVRETAWPRNGIDRFILARLEKDGLKPAPEADRDALIRRVAIDLTGLPPSLEEVARFVRDKDPKAYENLVERLMKSPAYGERWARVWLDLARYADSQGYAEDRPRTIWAYRDWVIRALNDNIPFDQFTVEQIAGDLLQSPSEEQVKATAFHRNTLTNTEGGTDDEEFRNAAVVDRVNTTMQVWMGLTINCTQCHNHKFDPFTQEEFYRLFAFFNSTEDSDKRDDQPFLKLFSPEQKKQRKGWEDGIARLEKSLRKPTPEVTAGRRKWEEGFAKGVAWKPLALRDPKARSGATLALQEDGSLLAGGKTPKTDAYTVRGTTGLAKITALRLEALPHPSLPKKGPGRSADGNFVLSRFTASLLPPENKRPNARFVRLEIPGKKKILSLAEVQVFSGGENLAPKGKARQSSVAYNGPAKLAIDGNTDGHYSNAKSTTHTSTQNNPWWEVDLGSARPVDRVVIWNRTDGGKPISSRLSNFRVLLLDAKRKTVETRTIKPFPNPKTELRPSGARDLAFAEARADFSQGKFPAAHALRPPNAGKNGWAVAPQMGKAHEIVFVLAKPLAVGKGSSLALRLEHLFGSHPGAALGRFRISATDHPLPGAYVGLPADVAAALKAGKGRTRAQQDRLAAHYRSISPELEKARKEIAALRKKIDTMKPRTTLPVMKELPPAKHRKTHIQIRGNFLAKGKEVTRGTQATLHPFPEGAPKNRLGLARWLVHSDNPLTARVVVNRHWEQLFGMGIVRTSEDWGRRGLLPSHPGLLDWLATDLMAGKWDVKALLRKIVTSATYRQSSRIEEAGLERDPDNLLLARGPRLRLSAEMVRDQALFVSGLLSRKMYGPSVNPPRPKLGLKAAFSGSTDWETSKGEDKFRRGLYTNWRRSIPYPSMAMFDAPSREVCTVKRHPTNTPLQALVTLNDPVYVECAQALGRRIVKEGGADVRARVKYGFRLCLSRPPAEREVKTLGALFADARGRFAKDPKQAALMATDPIGPAPKGSDVADLAAWTVVGNVLLNLDEMFMKR